MLYSHTELKVAARQGGKVGGVIGLHARDLHIEQVLVDGVEARFEIHNQLSPYEANSNHPSPYTKSHLEAADDAYRKYSGDLYGESDPELHIFPPASPAPTDPGQEVTTTPEVSSLGSYPAPTCYQVGLRDRGMRALHSTFRSTLDMFHISYLNSIHQSENVILSCAYSNLHLIRFPSMTFMIWLTSKYI